MARGDDSTESDVTLRETLHKRFAQVTWLRKLRARLPYRLDHWQARVMQYWQWDEPENIARNICGGATALADLEGRRDSIVWRLNPQFDDICLDLGCGIGRVEKFLAPHVREIHAVDFSTTMLETARIRLKDAPNVFFYQNDGASLSFFPDDMFDLAWAELVFHHVPVEITAKYLCELERVLKPKGRMIAQLPRKEFYEQNSRDICGWMTMAQADKLAHQFFSRVRVSQDNRHILVELQK